MVGMWPSDVLMEMFGTSGMTAYFGLRQCGPIMPSDTVLVASVTGSVGSILAQLARTAGARVIGLAGGEARCRWAEAHLGIDACLDYRSPDLADHIPIAAPDGVDVYCDGAGGPLTGIAVGAMKAHARLFAYGSSAAFFAAKLDPPKQRLPLRQHFGLSEAIEQQLQRKHIKTECWIVDAFYHERLSAEDELSRLLLSGALKPINTVVEGFDKLPYALVHLYDGGCRFRGKPPPNSVLMPPPCSED